MAPDDDDVLQSTLGDLKTILLPQSTWLFRV